MTMEVKVINKFLKAPAIMEMPAFVAKQKICSQVEELWLILVQP